MLSFIADTMQYNTAARPRIRYPCGKHTDTVKSLKKKRKKKMKNKTLTEELDFVISHINSNKLRYRSVDSHRAE